MQSPASAYSFGLAGAVIARGLSVVAGMLSLWLLARVLSTPDFAGYAAAMSYVILIGHVAGLGLERSMLLRISPVARSPDHLIGRTMMLRTALTVAALSLVVSGLTLGVLGAAPVLRDGATDDWIAMLWPIISAQALLLVLAHWYQANHWFGLSQVIPGVNDAARCLAFILVFALGLGAGGVAVGAALAALLPILMLAVIAAGRTEPYPAKLQVSDFAAGLQFLAMRFSSMGLRHVDLVVMGFLVGGIGTATYAVASRIGDLALLGQQAFGQTYAPRIRRHLADNDTAAITREYNATRALSFLVTLGSVLILVVLGRVALSIFGDFASGYPVLLLIAAGHILTASFGSHDLHLSMTGHLGVATANRTLGFVAFVGALALLVPRLDGIGAALSFVAASALYSVTGAILLTRRSSARMLHPAGIAGGFLASSGLAYSALTGASPAVAVAALLAAAALVVVGEAAFLRSALGFPRRA